MRLCRSRAQLILQRAFTHSCGMLDAVEQHPHGALGLPAGRNSVAQGGLRCPRLTYCTRFYCIELYGHLSPRHSASRSQRVVVDIHTHHTRETTHIVTRMEKHAGSTVCRTPCTVYLRYAVGSPGVSFVIAALVRGALCPSAYKVCLQELQLRQITSCSRRGCLYRSRF